MIGMLVQLLSTFGTAPWLERFLGFAINPKMLSGLGETLFSITGSNDVGTALSRMKNDKAMELEFQKALLVAETEYWQQCMQDRQNARERDMALQRARGQNRRANIMLALAMIGILLSVGCLIVFKAVLTSDVIGMISAVSAVFGSCLKDAYAFEFGSSGKDPRATFAPMPIVRAPKPQQDQYPPMPGFTQYPVEYEHYEETPKPRRSKSMVL